MTKLCCPNAPVTCVLSSYVHLCFLSTITVHPKYILSFISQKLFQEIKSGTNEVFKRGLWDLRMGAVTKDKGAKPHFLPQVCELLMNWKYFSMTFQVMCFFSSFCLQSASHLVQCVWGVGCPSPALPFPRWWMERSPTTLSRSTFTLDPGSPAPSSLGTSLAVSWGAW